MTEFDLDSNIELCDVVNGKLVISSYEAGIMPRPNDELIIYTYIDLDYYWDKYNE